MSEGVSFPRVPELFAKLEAAWRAVYEASGRPPTHFLVGWMTLGQLYIDSRAIPGQKQPFERQVVEAMRWRDLPLIVDPTRKHAVIAVPVYDFFVGRELPNGAVWEWEKAP